MIQQIYIKCYKKHLIHVKKKKMNCKIIQYMMIRILKEHFMIWLSKLKVNYHKIILVKKYLYLFYMKKHKKLILYNGKNGY